MMAKLSASAIGLSKKFLPEPMDRQGNPAAGPSLMSKLGAQTVVGATLRAVQLLGRQFVLGQTIEDAMQEAEAARKKNQRISFSYDMLGEGARTEADALRYLASYENAIKAIAAQALEATGVAHLALRNINTLSGGERARVHLARALAQLWEPRPDGAARWLLLDEPTAALDLSHQHQSIALLREWAQQQGVGVVAVLHDLNLALRYAHDALLLDGSACGYGAVADTLTAETIARVWQVECTATRAPDGVAQYLFA